MAAVEKSELSVEEDVGGRDGTNKGGGELSAALGEALQSHHAVEAGGVNV